MAARFLLTGKQYADVGEEWEQIETLPNGKQARKRYQVHTLLDPDDSAQHNYRDQGIIVALAVDPQFPFDLILRSAPNSEMQPLNPEAERVLNEVALLAARQQARQPMSEEAFPTTFVAQAKDDPLADIKRQLAELTGLVTNLKGENDELKAQLLRAPVDEGDLEDVIVEDASPPPTVQPQPKSVGL